MEIARNRNICRHLQIDRAFGFHGGEACGNACDVCINGPVPQIGTAAAANLARLDRAILHLFFPYQRSGDGFTLKESYQQLHDEKGLYKLQSTKADISLRVREMMRSQVLCYEPDSRGVFKFGRGPDFPAGNRVGWPE